MARILVTGGAGFIGSHVAERLLENNHSVVIIDDLSGGYKDNIPESAIFYQGSITDKTIVERLFAEYKFDYIYHCAAYAAENLSHFIKLFNYRVNFTGSIILLNEALRHKVKCFVFLSSIGIYGEAKTPFTENTIPLPIDSYGLAKLSFERELIITHKFFGMNYVTFRLHNVYGERQNLTDKYRNVAAIFMNQLMQDRPMTVFGDGTQTREFTYVKDILPALTGVIEKSKYWNSEYNLGSSTRYSVLEIARLVAKSMHKPFNIRYEKERMEVKHCHCIHTKVNNNFDCACNTPLEQGVERMVEWAIKNKTASMRPGPEIEIEQNFPKAWK